MPRPRPDRRRRRRRRRRRSRKLPVYQGPFRRAQAERLLWRAGTGPRPGEARRLAKLDVTDAVRTLTRPGPEALVGPEPHTDDGQPLNPLAVAEHGPSWWIDRMVRTSRPLVERMTLVWHDWFATSNTEVTSAWLMINQNELFRRHALGSFADLFKDVTRDPAMLIWQNGNVNHLEAPNENYAREMMELFSLGVNRGYTEDDVREQARALTGWTNTWDRQGKPLQFSYNPALHDLGMKTVFGQFGEFDWEDAVALCLANPNHPSFFVRKLWSYFIPVGPGRRTQRALERLYVSRGYRIRPVLEAILRHPALYQGPPMVKPPAIYTSGLLRAKGQGVDTITWSALGAHCGQQLFRPPNVAGWKDDRWMDSGTWLGRWQVAHRVLSPYQVTGQYSHVPSANELVDRALAFWNRPRLHRGTRTALLQFAAGAMGDAQGHRVNSRTYPVYIENALRQLIAMSPDFQVS